MTPPFEKDELRARGERARALMERDGLDALLVTGDFSAGLNYYYLSGHMPRDYQLNFSRPHVMVLPREGEPFLFLYGVNAENAAESSWVEDIVAYSPPFSGEELGSALAARGLAGGRIGAELGFDQRLAMPVVELRAMEAKLTGGEVVDASMLLWELRSIKTPAEVAYVREADAINADGLMPALTTLLAQLSIALAA